MGELGTYQVVVVGGGPAGLMAAGQAARLGAHTLLLEKMDQPGLKLRITGKGRCNLTNTAHQEDFISHFGREGQFLRQAFNSFFNQDLIDFMTSIGVNTITERGGRVFPAEGDASLITKNIAVWTANQGVKILTNTAVQQLLTEDQRICGIKAISGIIIPCQQVILSTGGASFSHTGSSGDGFRIAAEMGHTITPIRPALVPLKTGGDICQRMQGLSLKNIEATVFINGKSALKDFGELLFTHFGISGPIILSMSGKIVDALRANNKVELSIDLKPGLDEKKLDARLLRDIDEHGKRHFRSLLENLLPQKMVAVMADVCNIPLDKPCHQINAQDRARLLQWLKDFRVEINGHLPLDAGMVTAGGVSLNEVDPRTMQSRLVHGLYFAGEILDLAADTGGYNLQAAFSTGWLAGNSAAKVVLSQGF